MTRGTATQAVLMSVYRTLRLHSLDATESIANVPKTYLSAG